MLGAFIAAGRHHRDVFAHFGVDASEFLARIDAENEPEDGMLATDLYPEAIPTLERLTQAGHAVGIAGNQPERASAEIGAMGLPVSFVATSAGWGVAKPSPEFFERVIVEAHVHPARSPMSVVGSTTTCSPRWPLACAAS